MGPRGQNLGLWAGIRALRLGLFLGGWDFCLAPVIRAWGLWEEEGENLPHFFYLFDDDDDDLGLEVDGTDGGE